MSKPNEPRFEGEAGRGSSERSGALGALREPVGPKGRGVYIRRRLLVLAALLAVVAVVVLVFLKPGSNSGARSASQVEVPKDLVGDVQSDDDVDENTVVACTPEQLLVVPVTDKTEYAEGEQPQLSASIENTGAEACAADLGTAGMEFTVTSGEDQVWRASDCMTEPTNLAVILDPGKTETTGAISWVRERSSTDTCDIAREPVPAEGASYHLSVSVAGAGSTETTQFMLL